MFSKIYDKISQIIKENWKFLIIYSLLIAGLLVDLDYEIYSPGGLGNLEKRIEVENGYKSKGSFNLTYVTAHKGNVITYLLSYIIPNWDLVPLEDSQIDSEDYDDILTRGQIDLERVNVNALAVALEESNTPYDIVESDIVVYHVFENADTNLKTGDIIKSIDGVNIEDMDSVTEALKDKKKGDTIKLKVIRKNKTKECSATLYEEDGNTLMGLYLVTNIQIDTDVSVKFDYDKNESGASGGLMSSLEIYNRLTKEDLTKGLTIAGTGTIDLDGTVGEIGGIKYKLAGAVRKGADIFIAPTGENYNDAVKLKKEKDYDIKIIEAINFKQVVEALKEL